MGAGCRAASASSGALSCGGLVNSRTAVEEFASGLRFVACRWNLTSTCEVNPLSDKLQQGLAMMFRTACRTSILLLEPLPSMAARKRMPPASSMSSAVK